MPTKSSPSHAEAAVSATPQENRADLVLGESDVRELGETLYLPPHGISGPKRLPDQDEALANASELRALVHNASPSQILRDLRRAACRGLSPDSYHPDQGQPNDSALERCNDCQSRLACLVLALRSENPGGRCGWYGGLSPSGRDALAASLGIAGPDVLESDFIRAATLRSRGWTINAIASELHCSRRTVQRYLNRSAA